MSEIGQPAYTFGEAMAITNGEDLDQFRLRKHQEERVAFEAKNMLELYPSDWEFPE